MIIPDKVIIKKCENPTCGKEHDGSYGTGRFCSKECKDIFVGYKNKEIEHNSPKVKAHLDKLRAEGKIAKQAPYGTWTCKVCGKVLLTRNDLEHHMHEVHGCKFSHSISIKKDNHCICKYCGKTFESPRQMGGHTVNCPKHPLKAQHDEAHKQSGRTYSKRVASGEIKPRWNGHKHTLETRKKYLPNVPNKSLTSISTKNM